MKLTVLVDNHTIIGTPALGEPGLSILIEEDGKKLLLDAGEQGLVPGNAQRLGVSLEGLDYVVLSHGHFDHADGLPKLWDAVDLSQTTLLYHPEALFPKRRNGEQNGVCFTEAEAGAHMRLQYSKAPLQLTEKLWFLGEIPRVTDFEPQQAGRETLRDGLWREDAMRDDTALAYAGEEGVFVVTGCSHSGICNIIEYACRVCGDGRVQGVLGGFHLLTEGPQLEATAQYLRGKHIPQLCPCHCVSLAAKCALAAETPIREVGVGFSLEVK